MAKERKYKWGELEVTVEEYPVFDTKSNKFIGSLVTAKVQDIDFEKLTNEIIKRNPNAQVPFAIKL